MHPIGSADLEEGGTGLFQAEGTARARPWGAHPKPVGRALALLPAWCRARPGLRCFRHCSRLSSRWSVGSQRP